MIRVAHAALPNINMNIIAPTHLENSIINLFLCKLWHFIDKNSENPAEPMVKIFLELLSNFLPHSYLLLYQ